MHFTTSIYNYVRFQQKFQPLTIDRPFPPVIFGQQFFRLKKICISMQSVFICLANWKTIEKVSRPTETEIDAIEFYFERSVWFSFLFFFFFKKFHCNLLFNAFNWRNWIQYLVCSFFILSQNLRAFVYTYSVSVEQPYVPPDRLNHRQPNIKHNQHSRVE